MNLNLAIPLALHELASTIWIGGMFFATLPLRSALRGVIDPALRIPLSIAIFRQFFSWVWWSIATLWISGFWIAIAGYGHAVGLHVHIMMGIALVMTLLFIWAFVFPYREAVRIATDHEKWGWAGSKLSTLRKLMAVNLALGICNIVLAAAGPELLPGVRTLLKG